MTKAIPRAVSLLVFLSVFVLSSHSFQWPFPEPHVIQSFASAQFQGFACDVLLSPSEDPVHAISGGELIFQAGEGSVLQPWSGLGEMVVIHHQGDLRTTYAGLEEPPGFFSEGQVTPFTSLGKAHKHPLRLFLYDVRKDQFVNPFLVLPPLVDRNPPRIDKLLLEDDQGREYSLPSVPLQSGEYRLKASVYDIIPQIRDALSVLPYMTAVFINGMEAGTLSFDALQTARGQRRLSSRLDLRYEDLFDSQGYLTIGLLNLVPGRNNLEVIVRDIAGNETVRSYRLEVR